MVLQSPGKRNPEKPPLFAFFYQGSEAPGGALGCRYTPLRTIIKILRLMDKILHDPKDPNLWELWYIPSNG